MATKKKKKAEPTILVSLRAKNLEKRKKFTK